MKKQKLFPYIILTLIILAFLQYFYDFLNIDLSIPIYFRQDGLLGYSLIKSFMENQWNVFDIPKNAYLGAPDINTFADFPMSDFNLMYIIIKLLSFFCKNYVTVFHIYFLSTFFLISYTSYYVFKKFKITTEISIFASLLFTFAPFHIYRSIWHINYSSYYLIPMMMLVVFWIWNKKPLFFKYRNNKWELDIKNKKSIFAIIIAILSGISNIYFDYFWIFFLTIAAITALFYRKNVYNFLSYVLLALFNFCIVILNMSPYIIHRVINGANTAVISRHFNEVEYFGLKIVQLLLPVNDHFLFSTYTWSYNHLSYLINENASVTLGIIAAAGFLFALFYTLFVRNLSFNIFNKSGVLIISALLLATIGSFSSFIAYVLKFTQIRCYNRISIFIAFLSILVIAVLLKKLFMKYKNKYYKMLFIVILIVFGIRDEVPLGTSWKYDYIETKDYYNQTKEFIKNIENLNENGAMIFQLPYSSFPENKQIEDLPDYEQLKPYLVSDTNKLHYSYGAMKGREISKLNLSISQLPVQDMITKLKEVGFNGILINKKGYSDDNRETLINDLNTYLTKPPIENDDYIYYQL